MAETRERDLVLGPNEYSYILDKTKGQVACVVGSYKMSLSNTDVTVVFNERTGRFDEVSDPSRAIHTFITAPENWYIVLKNPTLGGHHPTPGTSNSLPELEIGKKINILGNTSFALFPGQMAKVIRGHRMHSNQYLKARVYNAATINAELKKAYDDKMAVHEMEKQKVIDMGVKDPNDAVANENIDAKLKALEIRKPVLKTYVDGQILIIKGTDCPFYMPPTGIEVLPIGGSGDAYVRDAVTLENLEYCVKKKENGEKDYIHGPAVVFPDSDEVFIHNDDGSYKFHAFELTDISGIYVKVLEDYTENGVEYHSGEELFITGKNQKIYYPRKEHAIIDYEGKIVHHAIAIPEGEGRYVLNRKTGSIDIVCGPIMFLPNPIDEVVVRRKLTKDECKLWFPGSVGALKANGYSGMDFYDAEDIRVNQTMPRNTSSSSGFSRGTSFTEPRTITMDNRYNGVVSINVFSGYAVNVIGRSGSRRVVVGPKTCMLKYDETLETLSVSTGKPKTTDCLETFVYLQTKNNKISDIIHVQTSDFVDMHVKVSYCVDFLEKYKDHWFEIGNYVKYMTDRLRSIVRGSVKKIDAGEFYENATDIVHDLVLGTDRYDSFDRMFPALETDNNGDVTETASSDTPEKELKELSGRIFQENGMLVHDVEVLSVIVDRTYIGEKFLNHHARVLDSNLEVADAELRKDVEIEKSRINSALLEVQKEEKMLKEALENDLRLLIEKNSSDRDLRIEKYKAELDALQAKNADESDRIKEQCINELSKIRWQREIDDLKSRLEKSRVDQEISLAVANSDAAISEVKSKAIQFKEMIEKFNHANEVAINSEKIRIRKEVTAMNVSKVDSFGAALAMILEEISPELAAALNVNANRDIVERIMTSVSPYALANGEDVVQTITRMTKGTPIEQIVSAAMEVFGSGVFASDKKTIDAGDLEELDKDSLND